MRTVRVIGAALSVGACGIEDRGRRRAVGAALALALVAAGLGGCAQSARGADATVDAVAERGDTAFDADRDGDAGALDGDAIAADADAGADEGADAAPDVDVDAFTACDPDAATAPAGLGQSCAPDSGVDPRYCEEVHYCGGVYTMGTHGWEPNPQVTRPIGACDLHPAVAHSGFVDAYEVTVGRFRQWVQAGMPRPEIGDVFFNDLRWTSDLNGQITLPDHEGFSGRRDRCTYTAAPGPNDARPLTCTSLADAIAFCWWDGKHLATEVGWEYVARNRGTTDATPPVPASMLTGSAVCSYGDVEGMDGTCAWETVPQPVGTHAAGDTLDPPGVHDLYGGVREMTIGLSTPYNLPGHESTGPCVPDAGPGPQSLDGDFVKYIDRGASWLDDATDQQYFAYAATREPTNISGFIQTGQTAVEGIRCMRWEQEPR